MARHLPLWLLGALLLAIPGGAPGGAWAAKDTFFMDGKPIVVSH
jgi:hypothetical protein